MSPRSIIVVLSVSALAGVMTVTAGKKPAKVGRSPLPSPASSILVNSTLQSPGNTGDCTLGEAIQAANLDHMVDGCTAGLGPDTIMIPAGTYTLTTIAYTDPLRGGTGLPGIVSDITFQGAGKDSTIIERPSNAAAFRLMVTGNEVVGDGSGNLTINDLTMRGGSADEFGGAVGARGAWNFTLNRVNFYDNYTNRFGGAVAERLQVGRVVATDCTFTNNEAGEYGGAITFANITVVGSTFSNNRAQVGGAIWGGGFGNFNINISDSVFTSNHATSGAGAQGGGAISYGGTATITRSQFIGNDATSAGGAIQTSGSTLNIFDSLISESKAGSGGSLYLENSSLNLNRTTIKNSQATTHNGGGIYFDQPQSQNSTISGSTLTGNSAHRDGGAISLARTNLSLINTTIDGNSAERIGGGISVNGYFAPTSLALNNVTITGNHSSGEGGGILNDSPSPNITSANSIIALNTTNSSGGICRDLYAPNSFTSLGHNLVGVNDCASFTSATGDQIGTSASPINPLLGSLQDNGGTSFTRALLSGSPALDAANPAEPGSVANACMPSDQRGVTRPRDGNDDGIARCDIGAHENIGTVSCATPPSEMTAWWAFDGTAEDIIGDNNAALINSPTFAAGKVDRALTFNGSDQHAVVQANTALDIGAGPGLTFDAWFNPSEVNTARPLIEWNSGSGAEGVHLWISADFADGGQGPGSLFVNLRDIGAQHHIFSSAPNLLLANQWQHVAVTYDKTSGDAKIYLNGIVVAQKDLGIFTPQTAIDLNLGYRPAGVLAGRHFLGSLDEVELFNRTLDASEVRAIYFADAAGRCKPTPTASPAVINVTEQIRVTDSAVLLLPAVIAINENISVRDLPSLLPSAMIAINEHVSVSDQPQLLLPAVIAINEHVSVNDQPKLLLPAIIAVNENISVRDLPSLLPSVMIGINERISVNDTPTVLLPALIAVNENISVRDLPSLLPSAMIAVNEHVSVNDRPAFLLPAIIAVNEKLTVRDLPSLLPSAMIGINERISVNDKPSLLLPLLIAVNENISVRDLPALRPSAMIAIFEQIKVRAVPTFFVTAIGAMPTPSGTNVTLTTGAVAVTFENVTAAGTTTITPINPNSAGQLPGGYELADSGLAFEISTTATFSGSITLCFKVPSVTDPAVFDTLRVLHNENGTLVDRTASRDFATKTVCATVNSLSPFVVARLATGPRLLLQDVQNELNVLRGTTTDKRDRQKLDEIIKLLADALADSNWRDQWHLQPSRGDKVFDKLESGVLKLGELSQNTKSTVPSAVLQSFMRRLVLGARVVAQTAVIDASSANGNPTELLKANRALISGDMKLAAGGYVPAVGDYQDGWIHALNATR